MQSVYEMMIALPAILIALTFHEYAHGRVADWLGDDTPYYQGRLTINPLPHIDWMGFFMLLFFHFGWAKPVQVNPYNFKNVTVKKGMMLVSLAGPVMNIMLALGALLILRLLGGHNSNTLLMLVVPLVQINIILAVFNLLPIPPLDGSKVLAGLLPDSGAQFMYKLEPYGPLILLLLIFTKVAGFIIWPLYNILYALLYGIVF
ncbi:Peptidase M50 [Syntrophomonas zehnderi OL-4]|uniref:Peptidase M50 n=1 Tax=Syntrophomonas zehnderi OL-4 TaxID=690567 RepID=A0A0E3W3N1_9FIRM|nr:site-2 protease family protein [Syntrophomonas zehnderi]CFX94265.1 Peptidase M50 [Syntrophomonas zehnderi OL-4]